MPTDLYYFYESDLDKSNYINFYNSLPSGDLQNKFLNSTPNRLIYKDPTWVLQGYRGPHANGSSGDSAHLSASNGLQEVRYWWGMSKHVNWVPIVGNLVWATTKIVGGLSNASPWSSLYFDSKTGNCLSHDKEVAASKLNDIGNELFVSGKFDEAKEYFSNAYSHSSRKANYDVYKANGEKIKAEIDARDLNSQADSLFQQGLYQEAYKKYQEAYDKSQVNSQYSKYSSNRDKAQVEVDAINFNFEGDSLFNQGRYQEALRKYQEAYHKSTVISQCVKYSSNRNMAKAELDAIALSDQGNIFLNQGKFNEAISKYQAAYDKAQVSNQREKYKHNRDLIQAKVYNREGYQLLSVANAEGDLDCKILKYKRAQDKFDNALNLHPDKVPYKIGLNKTLAAIALIETYNSVLMKFSLMLTADFSDSEFEELSNQLEELMDSQYGNDSNIVNRFHIVSLRISRKQMNSYKESTKREDLSDHIEAIINLIEIEIEVLNKLNICDPKLEQELKSLEEQLNTLDNDSGQDRFVDITSIASRVEEIDLEVENKIFERLAQHTQLELGGNGLELRDPLIASAVETYHVDAMNNILKLRISSIEEGMIKQIVLLLSHVVEIEMHSLYDTINKLARMTNENKITVLPLLVMGKNGNHWVGLISERSSGGIVISYLDSENSNLEGLKECVLDAFKDKRNCTVAFKEIAVEPQRYNNCGAELIENIILYISGSRIRQEDAIYHHSSLLEQKLILAEIET